MFYKVNGEHKMAWIQRRYDLLCDFYKVMNFLADTYWNSLLRKGKGGAPIKQEI
jgi:hypothetical protein